jgi:flavin-dependent dehydrogenase
LDLDEYAEGRTLQPITGFRAGLIEAPHAITTSYDRAVSYGIRRCEFDHYLLARSRARLMLGEPLTSIRRDAGWWVINDRVRAPMLVGAGGHFCPVARVLNPLTSAGPLVAAQETELALEAAQPCAVDRHIPELYFAGDLAGYGWCFRKGDYLNVGLGVLDRHRCSALTRTFVSFLRRVGRIRRETSWRWRGHAYLLSEPRSRRVLDDGVLLVGDAAGLAYPQSGEGIRPAIESGLMAASAIGNAAGVYSRDRLQPYETDLAARFAMSPDRRPMLPRYVTSGIAAGVMRVPFLVRHLVIDRWFLRSADRALSLSPYLTLSTSGDG